MIAKDRLMDNINRLKSEKESDVPIDKRAEHKELLRAAEMLDSMFELHAKVDTEEEAIQRFETTGIRRNYGQEQMDLIKFMSLLEDRLEQYFSRRELKTSDDAISQLDTAIELLYVFKHEIKQGKGPDVGNLILASSIINQLRDSFLTEENAKHYG